MKKDSLTEIINNCIKRYLNKNLIYESRGVSDDAIFVAKAITNAFLGHLEEMYEQCLRLEENSMDDDTDDEDDDVEIPWYISVNSWEDDFWYEFDVDERDTRYHIEVSMDSNSNLKAETDGDGEISVNFAPIKELIDKYDEYLDEPAIKNKRQYIQNEIYNYLYPIILHELTHNKDESGVNPDYYWISNYHKHTEEDLREHLWLFADNEINARVSSSYALMENYLKDLSININQFSTSEIYDLVTDVMNDNEEELHLRHMNTCLSLMLHDHPRRDYIPYCKARYERPYCLPYDLFKNDRRLKNNRTLQRLFNQNCPAGIKYVYYFYKNLLRRYKERIIRTCFKAVQDYMDNNTN